ncbi:MAG TPA: flagellar hook-basal body complex protein FliE [Bryobacteraceae bacterium]|nr:flagellar hook-basal body complex protein FliE [Bryobacteraceae bacterium]
MANPIAGISPSAMRAIDPSQMARSSSQANDGSTFSALFEQAVSRVNQYQKSADTAVERFITGEDEDLHRVAMATQQAEVSFELFLQMKNKVVQAYQEVMRLQV